MLKKIRFLCFQPVLNKIHHFTECVAAGAKDQFSGRKHVTIMCHSPEVWKKSTWKFQKWLQFLLCPLEAGFHMHLYSKTKHPGLKKQRKEKKGKKFNISPVVYLFIVTHPSRTLGLTGFLYFKPHADAKVQQRMIFKEDENFLKSHLYFTEVLLNQFFPFVSLPGLVIGL